MDAFQAVSYGSITNTIRPEIWASWCECKNWMYTRPDVALSHKRRAFLSPFSFISFYIFSEMCEIEIIFQLAQDSSRKHNPIIAY